jgi:tRNA-binding EMAP/Myf-like protein
MVDISEYKVGEVESIEEMAVKSGGKPLRLCMVNVGDEELVPVVTSASNVREKSRVVVALAGSSVIDDEGEEMKLQKTTVGGKMSHGMLCDSRMLSWQGGAVGVAVQMPPEFEIGSPPPSSKPRPKATGGDDDGSAEASGSLTGGLFERKLSKYTMYWLIIYILCDVGPTSF